MLTISRSIFVLLASATALFASPQMANAQGQPSTPAAAAPAAHTDDHAHAAGDDHAGHDHAEGAHDGEHKASVIQKPTEALGAMIVSLLVFSICFAVLALKVWPKILGGLKDREGKIRNEIESAEAARKQASEALESYQKSLADARVEAQKEIEKARAQAQAISADLRAKAEVELTALRERAMKDIENAKRAAVSEIYESATTMASAMAGKILRRQINAGDQSQLVEETMAQLQGMRS